MNGAIMVISENVKQLEKEIKSAEELIQFGQDAKVDMSAQLAALNNAKMKLANWKNALKAHGIDTLSTTE